MGAWRQPRQAISDGVAVLDPVPEHQIAIDSGTHDPDGRPLGVADAIKVQVEFTGRAHPLTRSRYGFD